MSAGSFTQTGTLMCYESLKRFREANQSWYASCIFPDLETATILPALSFCSPKSPEISKNLKAKYSLAYCMEGII